MRLCAECGMRAVEPKRVEGRRSAYRNFDSLPIPADLPIPTCTNCGAEWFDRRTSERLDQALAEAGARRLADAATEAIGALAEVMNQRDLESRLGLSAGYLSKLKHGKEAASAPLVALLSLLSARPARLAEIQRVWETGRLPPRITADNVTRVEEPVGAPASVAS